MAMLCLSLSAFAYDFEVDGFYYDVNIEKMTATLVAGENEQVGDIIIPEKVTYKGRNFDVTAIRGAFKRNTELTGVTIPQSITSLGDSAFYGCSSLKSISGMDNVTDIGVSCFCRNRALTSITLPLQLKTIGNNAFGGCLSLSQIEIPQEVISVGCYAFSNCTNLTSISLPNSLTSLPSGLFYGCESIAYFEVPTSTTSICNKVFSGCISLTSISIPSSVESIGDSVFMGCSNLSNVVFEQSSTGIKIGYNREDDTGWNTYYTPLFEDCNLTKAEIGRNISSRSGYWRENWGCFAKTGIQTVIFSKNVTYLEEGAFKECANLTEISIPNSISSIGENTFYGSGIKSITFEDGYEDLLCEGRWDYDETFPTFAKCKIENAYIGRTLSISNGAENSDYEDRPSTFFPKTLHNLIIGDCVKNIDVILMSHQKVTSSLSHYSNLKSVQFGTNLSKLPSLIDNSLLTHLSTSSTTPPTANPFSNSQYMDLTVEIPDGSLDAYKIAPVWSKFWEITESPNLLHCIEGDGILYRILSGNEVEVIKKEPDYAGNISIPSNIKYNNTTYKVISIGEAFKGCSNLISISLPSSIVSLDNNCFANCVKLEKVDINGNLEYIPYGAFQNCTSISNIQIPQTVTRISGCAFKGCSALKYFTCQDALSYIGESTFQDCTTITSFSFNNVSSIGHSALKGCGQLKDVELNNKISVIPTECFMNCINLETINNLRSIIRIENNAFEGCKLIKFFELPNVISIANYAFKDCNAANSFILGNRLKDLGDGVFYNCCSIESLIIPGNVENFGDSIFSGCSTLKNLTFDDGESILHLPVGTYKRATDVQEKEINGKTIRFKIEYYDAFFDDLPIEKLYIGRNLSDLPRYSISGDGGVDYYLIKLYDTPFNYLPKLKELVIGENVDVVGPNETFINEVGLAVTPGAFKQCYFLQSVSVLNSNPPTGVEFSSSAYTNATLIVPDNTVSLYQAAYGWKEFVKIIDESSTVIEDIYVNSPHCYLSIASDGITYEGDSIEQVCIYSIDGKLCYSSIVRPQQFIKLSKGFYVVRIKDKTIKIRI